MSGWIKCLEKLPEDCESVLIYTEGMTPISAYLFYDRKKSPICWLINDWNESDMTVKLYTPTHWMPLPQPPGCQL